MTTLRRIDDLPDDIRPVVGLVDDLFAEIYLVGGAVRDVILGKKTYDLDFATAVDSAETLRILTDANIFSVHTEGIEFGTISADIGGFSIQITTYRSEEYSENNRKPVVSSAPDVDSDLARRDFTFNAMALSRDEFVDPYDGVSDIGSRIIRAVSSYADLMTAVRN